MNRNLVLLPAVPLFLAACSDTAVVREVSPEPTRVTPVKRAPAPAAKRLLAPSSLAGATITLHEAYGDLPMVLVMESPEQGKCFWNDLDYFVYKPHGRKAQFGFGYTEYTRSKIYSYALVSCANSDEITDQPEELMKMPATLTFTSRKGKVYKGRLQGYVFDVGRGRLGVRFENTPVTITFR